MKKLLLILIFGLILTPILATTYYVDYTKADNTGAGTSWATAKKDLQNAINASSAADEIWVKEGIYLPTQDAFGSTSPADPRDKTFYIKNDVKIYGGFAGTETLLSQRNWQTKLTYLSGNIGTFGIATDNCYHVVMSVNDNSNTRIDGFIIGGGYSDVTNNTTITVDGKIITRNTGGGILMTGSATVIENCFIISNTAIFGSGAFINSTFPQLIPIFKNVTISGNSSTATSSVGGGVFLSSSPTKFESCRIITNNSNLGGGLAAIGGTPVFLNTIFDSNTAKSQGGAIYLTNKVKSDFTNSIFSRNSSDFDGGAFYTGGDSELIITNSSVYGNNATNAISAGGGLYLEGKATISNCILYDNFTPNNAADPNRENVFNFGTAAAVVLNYCIIKDAIGSPLAIPNATLTNCQNTNPQFFNTSDLDGIDNIWATADDGLQIAESSPAINSSNPATISPTTDIVGTTRTGIFDKGAYERPLNPACSVTRIYVNDDAAGTNNGLSWINAFLSLEDALQFARNCSSLNEIWVAGGNYFPSKDPFGNASPTDPRDKTFLLKNNLKVYGGFAGTETAIAQRTLNTINNNPSLLNGDIGVMATETDNCYHVVLSVGDGVNTLMDGFFISNGNNSLFNNTSITVEGVNIYRYSGAGLYLENSAITVSNIIFNNNIAGLGGGLLNNNLSNSTIINCIFYNNKASSGAGALNFLSNSVFTNSVFKGNQANNQGGGSYSFGGTTSFANCTFNGNIATDATGLGGGVFYTSNAGGNILNSILYGNETPANTTDANREEIYKEGTIASLKVDFSTIRDAIGSPLAITNTIINNCSNADPLFVNISIPIGADAIWRTADDGLKLMASSPAINSSDPSTTSPPTDIAGIARAGIFDKGAYERSITSPCTVARLYVNDNASGTNDGTSWANAFISLETALQKARDCAVVTEIWVAGGKYLPENDPYGIEDRNKTFVLVNKVKIYGGFAGIEANLTDRTLSTITTNPTILSGNIGDLTNNADNCYHVVISVNDNSDTILDGFIVEKGGYGNDFAFSIPVEGINIGRSRGAGIYLENSNIKIENCIFRENRTYVGAGLFSQTCKLNIKNSIFYNNIAEQEAGGLCLGGDKNILENCLVVNNQADGNGAGILVAAGLAEINTSTIYGNIGNSASAKGAGVYFNNPTLGSGGEIANTILYDNTTPNNTTDANREEIYKVAAFPSLIVENCMVRDALSIPLSPLTIVNANLVQCKNKNPLFILASNPIGADNIFRTNDDGLQLGACSDAIDAGNPLLLSPRPLLDLLDNNRVLLSRIDMGAYEATSNIAGENANLATSFTSITLSQSPNSATYYVNDCNSLIAKVQGTGLTNTIGGTTNAKVWIESTQPSQFVKRHYEITPESNPSSSIGYVTLYFTQQEFNDYNNKLPAPAFLLPTGPADEIGISHVRIEKRSGISSDGTGLPDTYPGSPVILFSNPMDETHYVNTNWNATKARWEIEFDVNGFSGFFLKTPAAVALPVRLISFTGKKLNENNVLNWVTSEEKNASHFEIERSSDARAFEKIGKVNANFLTKENTKYKFFDYSGSINSNAAIEYYRLKMVDTDGQYNYSKIINIANDNQNEIVGQFYPNPSLDNIANIEITAKEKGAWNISHFDLSGRLLKTENKVLEKGLNKFTVHNLPKGESIFQFQNENNLIHRKVIR